MEAEGDCSVVDSCLWCCDPSFMEGHLLEFLRGKWRLPSLPSRLHKLMAQSSSSSFPPSSSSSSCSSQLMEQAERDLCACFDCVEEYHRMVDSLVEVHHTYVHIQCAGLMKTIEKCSDINFEEIDENNNYDFGQRILSCVLMVSKPCGVHVRMYVRTLQGIVISSFQFHKATV